MNESAQRGSVLELNGCRWVLWSKEYEDGVLIEKLAGGRDRILHEIILFLFSKMQENKSGAEKRKDAVLRCQGDILGNFLRLDAVC